MKRFLTLCALIYSLFISNHLQARIIHVPADSSTIQGGINGAVDGDTVLVAEGHYYERINFDGKGILVTSEFLNDGDTSHIQNTIIDGDESGTVVSFFNGEDLSSIIKGFTIQNGEAYSGGGIACSLSSPSITLCKITDNEACDGGGIYCYQSSPTIDSCVIIQNTAFFYPPSSSNYNITINRANLGLSGGGFGGGILCKESSNATITNCTIAYNSTFVPLAGSAGGGIACSQSFPTLTRCAIYRNTAMFGWGGAIICVSGFVTVLNCTITHNSAFDGGGIFCADCLLWTDNCILWKDSPDEIYEYPDMPPSTIVVTYCDIEGGWLGPGNIDCCPRFCQPATDNYYLAENSCCVGGGEGGVDIGAFGVGCPGYLCGDVTQDGIIDLGDVLHLINYLYKGGPAPDPFVTGDTNCDETVELGDVLYLINYLYKGGPPPCEPEKTN